MNFNKKILTLLFILSLSYIQAQEAILTSGGDATGSGGSTSYSIGQTVYMTKTGSNTSVAEGVQQPFEISVSLGVEETSINLEMAVYPNPATDYLTLKVENSKDITYQLYDELGRIIVKEKVTGLNTQIHLDNLAHATYFLSVSRNNHIVKTFKIIKK